MIKLAWLGRVLKPGVVLGSQKPAVRFALRMATPPPAKRQRHITMAATNMLDTSDFDRIEGEMRAYDEKREQVVKRSRDIQKLSKQAIFSLHRGADKEAEGRLAAAKKAAEELLPVIKENPTLRPGSYSNAIEEYAEALAFRCYLTDGRLIRQAEVELAEVEEYLGGVLDFTGELGRLAVVQATKRDEAAVQKARDLVEAIFGAFLQFDLRNGSLRKKFDTLKWTARKLENTLYELSLTKAGLVTKPDTAGEPAPEAAAGDGDA